MRLCFYSFDPPLKDQAYASHGVARNFIEILATTLPAVLTTKSRRSINIEETNEICAGLPLWIHPSASSIGLRRFSSMLAGIADAFIFLLWLPILSRRLEKRETDRILVSCGADATFLLNLWLLQKLGWPVDVYLVDDIEDSSHERHPLVLKAIHSLLSNVLSASARVFAISPGFAQHLSDRFGVKAEWLPLPLPVFPLVKPQVTVNHTDQRHIVFVGAINRLYEAPLKNLYEEIQAFNESGKSHFKLILEIISYSDTLPFSSSISNGEWLVVHQKLSNDELQQRLSDAYACFLPYSFAESERLMVSTSFSCKILEYFQCGRPIIVYGPDYASIPRYFRELDLPLCATSRRELREILPQIEHQNTPELIGLYRNAWERFHSPKAIRSLILGEEN